MPDSPATPANGMADQFIKVSIPGERPWVQVVEVEGPTAFWGVFANDLLGRDSQERRMKVAQMFGCTDPAPALHDYQCGDLERFELVTDEDGGRWLPSPVAKQ